MLRVGTASADITPPVGVELSGYGYYLGRASRGVLDRLMARAVYLASDKGQLLFIGNDLIGVSAAQTQRTRGLCERHLGLPPQALMLAGTHTHSGPATAWLPGCGEIDLAYYNHLPYAWLELAREAMDAARPGLMRLARGPIEPVGFDRHVEGGPIDRELRLARFDVEGEPVAVMVNHSAHGVSFGSQNRLTSADWPGVLERRLEETFPGAVAVFVQGTCGTVNVLNSCKDTQEGSAWMQEIGGRAAQEATALAQEAEPVEGEIAIRCVSRQVTIPLEALSEEELKAKRDACWAEFEDEATPGSQRRMARSHANSYQRLLDGYLDGVQDTCAAEVQVLRVGPLRIAGIPGEMFMTLGQRILDSVEDGLVFVAGYANDFLGYFPTRAAYGDPRYTYPTELVPLILGMFRYKPGVGELLADAAIEACR